MLIVLFCLFVLFGWFGLTCARMVCATICASSYILGHGSVAGMLKHSTVYPTSTSTFHQVSSGHFVDSEVAGEL